MEKKIVFFPGCLASRKFPGFEISTIKIFEKLGINFENSEEFTCCPDPVWIRSMDKEKWIETGIKNLEIARKKGEKVVTICTGCFETLFTVGKEKGNGNLPSVEHLLYTLWKNKEKLNLKKKIVNPLKGKKFGIHEGCHFKRPSYLLRDDFPEIYERSILKEMVELLGAEGIYVGDDCCGLPVFITDKELSIEIGEKRINSFKDVDGIVVICPSCFSHFETVLSSTKKSTPVYFYFELLAYAMGIDREEIGFEFHRVKINI
jgi:heterodisulfide reductase subunit B